MGTDVANLLDLLFPPLCLLCEVPLSPVTGNDFCPRCIEAMPPLSPSRCLRCALPFATLTESVHLCEGCLRHPPPFDWVRGVGLHEAALRDAIHRYKFHGEILLSRPLGRMLATALAVQELPWQPQLLVPVPLHRRRLQERTFNQALLLARQLGATRGLPVVDDLLVRQRPTAPQLGLNAAERNNNLQGAFLLRRPLEGQRILLIDDVMTTGATVRACAETLRQGGAEAVGVAVLARARRNPRPETGDG